MAERKVNGKDVLLFLDPLGGTDYTLIVCLLSNSLKRASSTIEAATKCGPDSQPGTPTVSIDFSGVVVYEAGIDRMSEDEIHDLWADNTIVGWKMGTAVPVTGDVIYSGTGFVSGLDATYDLNGANFSGTLGVSGYPTKVVTA